VNGDDGVAGVIVAGEERVLLQPVELPLERDDVLLEVLQLAVAGERRRSSASPVKRS
jgi:hypothetical protein